MKKAEFIALSIAVVVLVAGLVTFHVFDILDLDTKVTTAEMIEIIITFSLALITFIYVKRTAEISKANTKMVKEAESSRFAAFKPILTIDECLTSTDKIQIGLVIERGELPQYYPCNINNIGSGPALNVKTTVYLGLPDNSQLQNAIKDTQDHTQKTVASLLKDTKEISVIGKEKPATDGPYNVFLEPKRSSENVKVVRVLYEDIFHNKFESFREVWLDGKLIRLGPLQINELCTEGEITNDKRSNRTGS